MKAVPCYILPWNIRNSKCIKNFTKANKLFEINNCSMLTWKRGKMRFLSRIFLCTQKLSAPCRRKRFSAKSLTKRLKNEKY